MANLDAFVANGGPNKLWLNDGTGVFTDSGQALGNSVSFEVVLGDLDSAGDLAAHDGGAVDGDQVEGDGLG